MYMYWCTRRVLVYVYYNDIDFANVHVVVVSVCFFVCLICVLNSTEWPTCTRTYYLCSYTCTLHSSIHDHLQLAMGAICTNVVHHFWLRFVINFV